LKAGIPLTVRRSIRIGFGAILVAAWASAIAFGAARLWRFDGTAGAAARPPLEMPPAALVPGKTALPKLVLLIHPKCPCSRATIGELARLMAQCNGKLLVTVLMLRPENAVAGWEKTDLWRDAAAIPGVKVVADEGGEQARRFGAVTSGQALLYGADGRLLFSGGITESRGHSGDNAGRDVILGLVLGSQRPDATRTLSTPVYGCPLFDDAAAGSHERSTTCHK
jgi:hypothetical protein